MGVTRIVFAISACLGLAIGTAHADFVGFNIGASQWAPTPQNTQSYSDSDRIDLVDDLELENPEQSSMVLILEHPIKTLPNFRYQGYELDSTDDASLPSDLRLNGEFLRNGNGSASTVNLSQDDVVFYYQLPGKHMSLDLGVDLKSFTGEILLDGIDGTRISVDETIPLLYLSARYDLPNSGFYVGANINTNIIDLGLSESSAQDSTIMLGYDSGNGLGVEGGFKYFSLDLNDVNQPDTELEYDGIYLNGYFNF
ncbi:MAG: TIGR04219 family outer membrane beta-barrel protein [Gammaproteobacteria bacterium]|nr:TIGR04219 family outer membrane beta-barrel protein [Gammaproteobacteria bacterium]